MNSPNQWQQEETEYQVQGVRREQARAMQSRRFNHSRSVGRAVSTNGIHRRRNKRWSW